MSSSPTPLKVIGPCGRTYCFRGEYAGVLVQCPTCRQVYRVPNTEASDFSPIQKFLMKKEGLTAEVAQSPAANWQKSYDVEQEVWSTIESYRIRESGSTQILAVADRPRRFLNVIIYAALMFWIFVFALIIRVAFPASLLAVLIVGGAGVLLALLFSLRFKFAKRDISFFTSERRGELAFFVRDMNQMEFPTARFRVEEPDGRVLGELIKPWIGDVYASPWTVHDANGKVVMKVREESVVLSFLRRIFATELWWFRTNFVLVDTESEEVCGEYNRKAKLHDEYVLDLRVNPIEVDIRVLWALGVLLDSAERR